MSTNLKILKLYTSYWVQKPWLLIGSLFIGPAAVLQTVMSPLFIAKALGQLASHHPVNSNYIVFAGISLVVGACMEFIATHYYLSPLDESIIRNLYARCLHHLLRQEPDFFANNFSGALITKANRLASSYNIFSFVIFLNVLGQLCSVIAAIGIMLYYNVSLGLGIAALWLLSVTIVTYLGIARMRFRRRAVAKESEQTGEFADIITNISAVKTFAREHTEEERYDRTNRERGRLLTASWAVAIRNGFVVQLLCGVLQMAVFVGGIFSVEHGSLTIAMFLLFQVYVLRIIVSISSTSLFVRQLEGVFGDAAEMTELLEREPTIQDPVKPEKSHIQRGAIELRGVDFSYTTNGSSQKLLQGFNLNISPGEKVGLVGPSGGGKSTLTKLLLRFIDVQDGSISIDSQDVRNLRQVDLHHSIAYVPQEPLLFHRSIRENIRYGLLDATDEEVIRVAKQAHAHEFITALPDQYDTLVGERGVKLSGGQRQRIAIARAMIQEAPILILDEATSALDSESEVLIQDSLWKLMRGRTTIVIAHRLSTIQKMDRIIVLDHGAIVEQGTHKELLKHKGLYAKLWAHQSGGFIDD